VIHKDTIHGRISGLGFVVQNFFEFGKKLFAKTFSLALVNWLINLVNVSLCCLPIILSW